MTNNFIDREFRRAYIKKVVFISIGAIIWFFFGTMMILRDSIKKDDLKVISGELTDWRIVEIPGYRQMIDVLTFNVKNHSDKVALYLNSFEDYKPLTDKFEKGKLIKILYNDKGHVAKDGYNLHVYEIIYDQAVLLDYNKRTQRGKTVGLILYGVGLLFGLPLLFFIRTERKRKAAANSKLPASRVSVLRWHEINKLKCSFLQEFR